MSSQISPSVNTVIQQLSGLNLAPEPAPKVDEPALIQQAQNFDQNTFRGLLSQLDDAYHNSVSLVSDLTYDQLRNMYEVRFGPYGHTHPLPRGEKVNLPYILGDLGKPKEEKGFNRWIQNHPGPYVIEDKIDGLTLEYLLIIDSNGNRTEKLYTQGNGIIGKDVSHIVPHLKLPKSPISIAIRGEGVITKEIFSQFGPEYKSARNTVSGLVNSETSFNPVLASKIKYITYQILNSQETPEQQIITLKSLGFEIPWAVTAPTLTHEYMGQLYDQRNKIAPYEMDGMVIYRNVPAQYPVDKMSDYVIAYKPDTPDPTLTAETVVNNIVWVANKDRELIPSIRYQPIEIPGATMKQTNGDNARYIVQNGIGPGARIIVTRSKGTIPRIVSVIQPAQPLLPNPAEHGNYGWDANQVHFILLQDNNETLAARIEHFFDKLGIENIGPKRVAALVKNGFTTLRSVLLASPEQLASILGPTLGPNAYHEIHTKIENVPLNKLMAASNIFPNVGERRFDDIISAYPQIVLWWKSDPNAIAKAISQLKGFNKLSIEIANRMSEFGDWLASHPMITFQQPGVAIQSQRSTYPSPHMSNTLLTIDRSIPAIPQNLTGMTVVISGNTSDKEFRRAIEERGGKIGSAVSKNTNFLIMKNIADIKGKANKAVQLGVPILSMEEFRARYLN